MGEVVPLLRPEFDMDLDEADVNQILECTRKLPGQWRARLARVLRDASGPVERRWAYIFSSGGASDAIPVLTISRTSRCYTVVSWDILDYISNGGFASCCVPTIGEALEAIKEIILQVPCGDWRSGPSDDQV